MCESRLTLFSAPLLRSIQSQIGHFTVIAKDSPQNSRQVKVKVVYSKPAKASMALKDKMFGFLKLKPQKPYVDK